MVTTALSGVTRWARSMMSTFAWLRPQPRSAPHRSAAHGFSDLLHGHAAHPVQIVQSGIDRLKAFQESLQMAADGFAHTAAEDHVQKQLGSDDRLRPHSFQRFPTMRSLWPIPLRPGLYTSAGRKKCIRAERRSELPPCCTARPGSVHNRERRPCQPQKP